MPISNEEYVYKLLVFMNSNYNISLHISASQWGNDSRWFSNHEKKNTTDHYPWLAKMIIVILSHCATIISIKWYFLIKFENKICVCLCKFDLQPVYNYEHPRINILLATCFSEIHQQWTVYMWTSMSLNGRAAFSIPVEENK